MPKHDWLYVLAFAVLAYLSAIMQAQDDAMAVCQLSHSFDTCHEALNP